MSHRSRPGIQRAGSQGGSPSARFLARPEPLDLNDGLPLRHCRPTLYSRLLLTAWCCYSRDREVNNAFLRALFDAKATSRALGLVYDSKIVNHVYGLLRQFLAHIPHPIHPTEHAFRTSGPRACDLHTTLTIPDAVRSSISCLGRPPRTSRILCRAHRQLQEALHRPLTWRRIGTRPHTIKTKATIGANLGASPVSWGRSAILKPLYS